MAHGCHLPPALAAVQAPSPKFQSLKVKGASICSSGRAKPTPCFRAKASCLALKPAWPKHFTGRAVDSHRTVPGPSLPGPAPSVLIYTPTSTFILTSVQVWNKDDNRLGLNCFDPTCSYLGRV